MMETAAGVALLAIAMGGIALFWWIMRDGFRMMGMPGIRLKHWFHWLGFASMPVAVLVMTFWVAGRFGFLDRAIGGIIWAIRGG